MADDYRRVEPRAIITGSGLTADPDRIENLHNEAARYGRVMRAPPSQKFSDVMQVKRETQAKQRVPPSEEELAALAAREKRKVEERLAIRKLMGGGTVHPEHDQSHRTVALKA